MKHDQFLMFAVAFITLVGFLLVYQTIAPRLRFEEPSNFNPIKNALLSIDTSPTIRGVARGIIAQMYVPSQSDGVIKHSSAIPAKELNQELLPCYGNTCLCKLNKKNDFTWKQLQDRLDTECTLRNRVENSEKPGKEIDVSTQEGNMKSYVLNLESDPQVNINYGFKCYSYEEEFEQPRTTQLHYQDDYTNWLTLQELASYSNILLSLISEGKLSVEECVALPQWDEESSNPEELAAYPEKQRSSYYGNMELVATTIPYQAYPSTAAMPVETLSGQKPTYVLKNNGDNAYSSFVEFNFQPLPELAGGGHYELSFEAGGFITSQIQDCFLSGTLGIKDGATCENVRILGDNCFYDIKLKGECGIITGTTCPQYNNLELQVGPEKKELAFTTSAVTEGSITKPGFIEITQNIVAGTSKLRITLPKKLLGFSVGEGLCEIPEKSKLHLAIRNLQIKKCEGTCETVFPPDYEETSTIQKTILLMPESNTEYSPLLMIYDKYGEKDFEATMRKQTRANAIILENIRVY